MKTLDIRVYKNSKPYTPEEDSAEEAFINQFKKDVSDKYRNFINEIYASGGWFEVELSELHKSKDPDLTPRNIHTNLLERLMAVL